MKECGEPRVLTARVDRITCFPIAFSMSLQIRLVVCLFAQRRRRVYTYRAVMTPRRKHHGVVCRIVPSDTRQISDTGSWRVLGSYAVQKSCCLSVPDMYITR